jgi:hypothetical protein
MNPIKNRCPDERRSHVHRCARQRNSRQGDDEGRLGSYFGLFPDYYIEIEQILSKGDLAVAYGYAGAGTKEKAWKIPAAWRAIVRGEKIKLWEIYADTKIQFERMETCAWNRIATPS